MKNILSKFKFLQCIDTDKSRWYPNIQRDWMFIFLCGIILTIFFLSFHVYLYLQTNREDFLSQTPSVQNVAKVVNVKELTSLLADFSTKKERFNSIVQKPEFLADPSNEDSFPVK